MHHIVAIRHCDKGVDKTRPDGKKKQGTQQGLVVCLTSYMPGRTRASLPKYRQISAEITSRSIPSRGTKYSFCLLLDVGGAVLDDLFAILCDWFV